jgi:hypothetical protein
MKLTKISGSQAAGRQERLDAARARQRYLRLVASLSAPPGYSAPAMNLSLRHCQAMMEEYQQIMRMIVRPCAQAASE